jgi:hypothetical protein
MSSRREVLANRNSSNPSDNTAKTDKMFLPLSIPEEQRTIFDPNLPENKRILQNCLSGIIVLGQNKQVIKKEELNKLIYTGTRRQHHTITKAVMAYANHDLNKYLGMRLFDLGESKGYLLVNTHSIPNHCRKEFDIEECNELSVIFLALMEIFSSSDESCTEAQIKEVLSPLELSDEDLKRHFDMLQKKLYIVPLRNTACQQEERLYKWGPRAVAEVDPDRFMKSFLDFADAGSANDWPDQKLRIEALKNVANRSDGRENRNNRTESITIDH